MAFIPMRLSALEVTVRRAANSLIAIVAATAAISGQVRSQETAGAAINGATATVVEKDGAELHVTVENHRNSPLVKWRIESSWISAESQLAVAPHARDTLSVRITDDRPATRPTALALALFADGYYEGVGRSFDEWMTLRTEHLDDLRYWVTAFMSMPRASIAEMRAYLSDHAAERASRETHQVRHVSDLVQDLLRRYPESQYIEEKAVEQLRKDLEAELTIATRTWPDDVRPGRVEAVTAASLVAAETTRSKSYSVVIENKRDVAIEAFGIDYVDPATGRVMSGMSTDLCTSDPAREHQTPGRGRIQPHERRDLRRSSGPPAPGVRLSFVMFDDLVFEGDPSARDRLLHERDQQAGEYAFGLATLAEAITKPPAQLEGFLIERRVEHIKDLQQSGRQVLGMSPIEEFLRDLKESSPERFLANAEQTRVRLEEARKRLTRHLSSVLGL
jgi:hypothetical protein